MLPARLKDAREKKKISQEKLGIMAGIDEATASARMNQYEKGVHTPDFELVRRLAAVLDVPTCYFYVEEDELAEIVLNWYQQQKVSD